MVVWRRLRPRYPHPDQVRMTLGEHLEELRTRLIRAILALIVGAIICFGLSDYVMGFLCSPVLTVLERHDQPVQLNYFNPAEAFVTDVKVALIVGFIITTPYSLTQIWGFVAAGLYPNERRWVHRFAPVSIALFFAGAAFLLTIVAPLLLDFLFSYRTTLPDLGRWVPEFGLASGRGQLETEGVHEVWPVSQPTPAPQGDAQAAPPLPAYPFPIPAFEQDPEDPPEGVPWLNRTEWQIRIRYGEKTLKLSRLTTTDDRPRLTPTIRIAEYIMFVLHLAAAFGIGFQVPVVVAFLAAIGIATAEEMATFRRYVWLAMAVMAAIITPPDVTSMLFLLGPMAILYEVGLIAARFLEREAAESA